MRGLRSERCPPRPWPDLGVGQHLLHKRHHALQQLGKREPSHGKTTDTQEVPAGDAVAVSLFSAENAEHGVTRRGRKRKP